MGEHLFCRGFDTSESWQGATAVLRPLWQISKFSEWGEDGFELVWSRAQGWSYRGWLTGYSPNRPREWELPPGPDRYVCAPIPVPVFAFPAALGRWMHRLAMGDLDIPADPDGLDWSCLDADPLDNGFWGRLL